MVDLQKEIDSILFIFKDHYDASETDINNAAYRFEQLFLSKLVVENDRYLKNIHCSILDTKRKMDELSLQLFFAENKIEQFKTKQKRTRKKKGGSNNG